MRQWGNGAMGNEMGQWGNSLTIDEMPNAMTNPQ